MKRLVLCILLAALPAKAGNGPVSGYEFLLPETRALQDDDFANPGMLWVETGQRLWEEVPAATPSCGGCHGEPSAMRGVGTRYPQWSEREQRVISLEQRINLCRTGNQKSQPLPFESEGLLGLTALVMHQSRGLPMNVATDGPAAAAYARGESYYNTRRGQLNLACANCHVEHVGDRLRGETISQGQVNGFPIYRQLWQTMGSVSRMIGWCNDAVRASRVEPGSQQAVDIELYLRARGDGLVIETPAVRR